MEEINTTPATDQEVIEEVGFTSKLWMPPANATSFVANGETYYRSNKLSSPRYRVYERLVQGGSLSFEKSWEMHKELQGKLNLSLLADAAVINAKIMEGMTAIDVNTIEVRVQHQELSGLFWNIAGEDDRYYDYTLMQKKFNDWDISGLDSLFFFQQTTHFIQGMRSALLEGFQNILNQEESLT